MSVRARAQLGLLAAVVVLAAAVATLLVMPRRSRPVEVADVGTRAPDFELPDLDHQTVTLSSLQGQAVVLFFKDPTHPQYENRVNRLALSYTTDERVKFLAIEVAAAQPRLVERDERAFPTLLDDSASVATRYSIHQLPMIVVIDPHGVVRYRGPFDNNADIAFATHSFAAEALQDVLESSTVTVAGK